MDQIIPYAPNRGLGFNRRTWRTGNAIGRALRPYAKSAYQKIMKYTSSQRAKRALFRDTKRAVRRSAFVGKQQSVGGGGGESKSQFTLVKPAFKEKMIGFLGKNTVVRSSGFAATSTQGVQNSRNLGAYFSAEDIVNVFASVGELTSIPAVRAAKCFLMNLKAKAMITNAESTNVHFTIYDVMATIDTGVNNVDPSTVFLAGNADAGGVVAAAAADATVPGATPFSNPRFVNCYKVLQQTPIILGPGQTHTHHVHYAPNRVYNLEKLYAPGITTGPLADLTVYTMIVHHGTPVHDATTETLVTLGLSKLDIVIMEEISWKQSVREYPFNSITTTLATNLTGEQMVEGAPTDQADTS